MFTLHVHLFNHDVAVPWMRYLVALVALAVIIYASPQWQMPDPTAGPFPPGFSGAPPF